MEAKTTRRSHMYQTSPRTNKTTKKRLCNTMSIKMCNEGSYYNIRSLFWMIFIFGCTLTSLPTSKHGFTYAFQLTKSMNRRRISTSTTSMSLSSFSSSSTSTSSKSSYSSRNRSRSNAPPDNYIAVEKEIVRLGRSGQTDEALDLYCSMVRPTVRSMNGAIDACARAQPTRLDTAFDVFYNSTSVKDIKMSVTESRNSNNTVQQQQQQERRRRPSIPQKQQQQQLRPNVFTFGGLMNACNRGRDAHRAIALLRCMERDYGVVPNEVVYSSAISACARALPPQPDQALQLLREAVEDKGLSMSVVGFNAAISACAQASDWENAIGLLSRMEDAALNNTSTYIVPEPDVVTYGTVLAACEKGGQWNKVLQYAQSMERRGLTLDGLAIMTCLHACAELGYAQQALRYLDMMKSIDNVDVAAPRTAKLERYGARKPLLGPDAIAYRCAISACARGGAWKDGIRLLDECKEVTGTPANVVAYTAAIAGCEYAGEWKQAFLLLDRMRKEGVEPNELTMVGVIGACATACAQEDRQGRGGVDNSKNDKNNDGSDTDMPLAQKKAMQLLNVLKKDPTTVKPNIQIYNSAIRVCAETNDVNGAFQLLQEVKDEGIARTQFTYGTIMTACERVGCLDSASKAFRLMKEDNITPNEIIYGAAISCCRKAKEPQRAMLLLKKMIKEELSPNAATLNTVMIAQADARSKSDSEKVLQVYKLMRSKYVQAHGRPNRQTYNILINFFASTKQPVVAEAFLDRMRKDDFKPDVDLFTATVSAYERTQQPLKAVQLMERMQEDGYDFYSVKVLNDAFKKAVKLVSAVGQSFAQSSSSSDYEKEKVSLELISMSDDEDLIDDRID